MSYKCVLQKLMGTICIMGILATGIPSYAADPASGRDISQQTIPVQASIDGYYEVIVPVNLTNLNGVATLKLSNAYSQYLTSTGDKETATFYGYVPVGVKGLLGTNKKVHAVLTCADLVKADEASKTAVAGMQNITDTNGAKAAAIFNGEGSDTNSIDFGSTTWTAGTTGVSLDYPYSELDPDNVTTHYSMIRTTLPVAGTYNSNLVIEFSQDNM